MSGSRLSKSRFVAGWQCHKLLWWTVHQPGAVELQPDKVLQDRFDQGRHVGELARTRFPGGVLIDLPHRDPARIPATRSAIEGGAPAVFEASFESGGVFVAADVLERLERGFSLIEVKSSSKVKDEHIPDAAVQAHVLRRSGIDVRRVEIMHLNPEHRCPDRGDLFAREDVTRRVEALLPEVPAMIQAQLAALRGDLPAVPVGPHCWEPMECPFWDRCWPRDEHHITTLYRAGNAGAWRYMQRGIHGVLGIPAAERLSAIQQRQKRAVETGRLIVEKSLRQALEPFHGRLGFLDFETVARAIPVWPGLAPWGAAAAQFSYHERRPNGTYTHVGWLAEGPGDPREELARAMLEATRRADRVVTYTAFEKTRIKELAAALPHLADGLNALIGKLLDLHPVVQNHVYHRGFRGSFSLKYILTPMVPELTYDDLVIVDGQVASVEIARLLFVAHKIPEEERDRLRQDLLAYCERDTWAMVKLVERLWDLAGLAG